MTFTICMIQDTVHLVVLRGFFSLMFMVYSSVSIWYNKYFQVFYECVRTKRINNEIIICFFRIPKYIRPWSLSGSAMKLWSTLFWDLLVLNFDSVQARHFVSHPIVWTVAKGWFTCIWASLRMTIYGVCGDFKMCLHKGTFPMVIQTRN